jgi:hypothetical protein
MGSELPLEGRVAVVTGASRGLGRSSAELVAELGADVVVVARTTTPRADIPGTIQETAEAVRSLGRRCLAVPADLTSDDDVTSMAEAALSEFGHVDVLINNAASTEIGIYEDFWTMTPETWRYQLALNVTAPWVLMKAFAPGMRERQFGLIVNMTSALAGLPSNPNLPGKGSTGAAYPTGKVALSRLTSDLAKEFRPYGISIVALHPGFVRTENSETYAPKVGFDISMAKGREVPMAALRYLLTDKDASALSGEVVFAPSLVEERSLL